MPFPSKQNELFEKVLSDIRTNYYPGARLPSEPVYAKYFGCGRTTLRKVLERLQGERKIHRSRGGTFVLDEKTGDHSRFNQETPPVYLLLPCADYTDRIDPVSLQLTREFLDGAMRGAIEAGRMLVTIPVSESNRDDHVECVDIAWSQISILHKNDIVLFLGRWYNRLIPILERTGCRIGFVSQMPENFPCLRNGKACFAGYTGYSNWAFIREAVKLMKSKGKKKLACVWFFLEEKEHKDVEEKFSSLLEEEHLEGNILGLPFHSPPKENYLSLKRFIENSQLDSLIIAPHLSDASWPSKMRIRLHNIPLAADENCFRNGHFVTKEFYVGHTPMFEAAKRIVKILSQDQPKQKEELFPYGFTLQKGKEDHE